jgi:prepilin-type N-terminal cleavage/methylation domain-containing protein
MRQVANQVVGRQRPAFTLIELLVVITIISILAALTIAGAMQYFETQRQTNTETNIRAVYQILQQHWGKVVDDARKETPSPAVLGLAGNDSARAQVIWVKFRLMEAFPETFTEILSTDPMGTKKSRLYYQPSAASPYIPPGQQKYMPNYLQALKKANVTGSTPPRPSEPSACLLLALGVNRSGSPTLKPDTLGPSISIAATDNAKSANELPYITDGWGTPLGFYRFPTGNTELTANANPSPNARFFDPLDPDGTLVAPTWYSSFNKTVFESICHKLASPKGAYLVPVIASAGKDGQLGMQPRPTPLQPDPMMPLNDSNHYDYDNIYSYRLRLGARGD